MGEKILPEGQDTVDALRDWAKDDVTESPSKGYDLGKFFFAVSTGTLGVVTGIERLGANPKVDTPLVVSLVFFILSIFVALNLVIPRVLKLTGETDLLDLHQQQVQRIVIHIYLWFGAWLVGLITGLYAALA